MHLFVMVRGIKSEVNLWIEQLGSTFLPFKLNGKQQFSNQMKLPDGTPAPLTIQTSVRPVQLFEIVFPKESLHDVCYSIRPWPFKKYASFWANQLRRLFCLAGMRLDPIPDVKTIMDEMTQGKLRPFPMRGKDIDCIGIGIKEDLDIADVAHEKL